MWYLVYEGRLKDAYTQLSANNFYNDLSHTDSALYFKSLRDRYLLFNVEMNDRLLEEEKNIAYVMCRLYEEAGRNNTKTCASDCFTMNIIRAIMSWNILRDAPWKNMLSCRKRAP